MIQPQKRRLTPLSRGHEAQEIINLLDSMTANTRLLPNMSDLRLINHSTDNIAGMHLINISCSPMTGWSQFKKRCLDIILSAIILLMILPVLCVMAIGVKLSSPGPVFYRQERVSWNGKPFQNEIPSYMQKHLVKAGITGWA